MFDTIYLVDTNTGEYVALAYGDPAQMQSLPPGFPGTTSLGTETINSDAPNGAPVQREASLDLVEGTTPDLGTAGPVCFARRTLICTGAGEQRVEDICLGDRAATLNNGWQQVRWVGRQSLTSTAMARSPQFRPILIRAGAPVRLSPPRLLARSLIARHHKNDHPVLQLGPALIQQRQIRAF